jgi:hypothetical protein
MNYTIAVKAAPSRDKQQATGNKQQATRAE